MVFFRKIFFLAKFLYFSAIDTLLVFFRLILSPTSAFSTGTSSFKKALFLSHSVFFSFTFLKRVLSVESLADFLPIFFFSYFFFILLAARTAWVRFVVTNLLCLSRPASLPIVSCLVSRYQHLS